MKLRKKKKASQVQADNLGAKLTVLSNEEAEKLLKKYSKQIMFECRKRSYIPSMDLDDLMQECKIRILAGYHLFDPERASEYTWVMNVIIKTLDGIWNHALKPIRACHILSEIDGEEIPVYNYSFSEVRDLQDQTYSIEDNYVGTPDGRPAFGTTPETPEESFFLFSILSYLKSHLNSETYQYIHNKIFPDKTLMEILELDRRIKSELQEEGHDHLHEKDIYEVLCVLGNISIKEANMLADTAKIMICGLGYVDRYIIDREEMLNILTGKQIKALEKDLKAKKLQSRDLY